MVFLVVRSGGWPGSGVALAGETMREIEDRTEVRFDIDSESQLATAGPDPREVRAKTLTLALKTASRIGPRNSPTTPNR